MHEKNIFENYFIFNLCLIIIRPSKLNFFLPIFLRLFILDNILFYIQSQINVNV